MRSRPCKTALPHILVVEDDPTSRAFFCQALLAFPAQVDAACSRKEAFECSLQTAYDLWIIDICLPDGSGFDLLAQLRGCYPFTPALAHTAHSDSNAIAYAHIIAKGFCGVLYKPFSITQLIGQVRSAIANEQKHFHSTIPSSTDVSTKKVWDAQAGISALHGHAKHIAALRQLFLEELPHMQKRLENAFLQENYVEVKCCLHQLQASCGFIGAPILATAVENFQDAPHSSTLYNAVQQAMSQLLTTNPLQDETPQVKM